MSLRERLRIRIRAKQLDESIRAECIEKSFKEAVDEGEAKDKKEKGRCSLELSGRGGGGDDREGKG